MSNVHAPTAADRERYARYEKSLPDEGWQPPQPRRPYEPGSDVLGPYGSTWRTCWYDGSIHPDDLLETLRAGARASEADWKYGWPHKFYIEDVQNPHAGLIVQTGSLSQRDEHKAVMGTAPATAHVKFYTAHLADAADFAALAAILHEQLPNITWSRDEGGVKWAGYRGGGVR